eukprot:m.28986 g.28986  ORF g.28986 m.28986 type:complete len:1031 (+) comp16015_c0_seq2:189-3281(+)
MATPLRVASRAGNATWECNVCTFINYKTAETCLMCSNAPPPLIATAPTHWNCIACTLSNQNNAIKCDACDTPRANPAHTKPGNLVSSTASIKAEEATRSSVPQSSAAPPPYTTIQTSTTTVNAKTPAVQHAAPTSKFLSNATPNNRASMKEKIEAAVKEKRAVNMSRALQINPGGNVAPVGLRRKDVPTTSMASPPTTLESGVRGKMQKTKFLRFRVVQLRGGFAADYVQLSQIVFLDSNDRVVTPISVSSPELCSHEEQAKNLLDGDPHTKWIDVYNSPLVFDFGKVVRISKHFLVTADDCAFRDPVRWVIEAKVMKGPRSCWVSVFDGSASDQRVPQPRNTKTKAFLMQPMPPKFEPNPSGSGGGSSNIDSSAMSMCSALTLEELDEQELSTLPHVENVRFRPLAFRGGYGVKAVQLQYIQFVGVNDEILVPVSICNPNGKWPRGTTAHNVVRLDSTDWVDLYNGGLEFVFKHDVQVAKYLLVTAGDDPACDPIRWVIEGRIDDTSDWQVLHDASQHDQPVPIERNTTTRVFACDTSGTLEDEQHVDPGQAIYISLGYDSNTVKRLFELHNHVARKLMPRRHHLPKKLIKKKQMHFTNTELCEITPHLAAQFWNRPRVLPDLTVPVEYRPAAAKICIQTSIMGTSRIRRHIMAFAKSLYKSPLKETFEETVIDAIAVTYGVTHRLAHSQYAGTASFGYGNVFRSVMACSTDLDWMKVYLQICLFKLKTLKERTKLAQFLPLFLEAATKPKAWKVHVFNIIFEYTSLLLQRTEVGFAPVYHNANLLVDSARCATRAMLIDYLDQIKTQALSASFLAPARLKFLTMGSPRIANDVENHGVNVYAAVLQATLGVSLPRIPYYDDEVKGVTDFRGQHIPGMSELWRKENFELSLEQVVSPKVTRVTFSDFVHRRDTFLFPGVSPFEIANNAVSNDETFTAARALLAPYLDQFCEYFSEDFILEKLCKHACDKEDNLNIVYQHMILHHVIPPPAKEQSNSVRLWLWNTENGESDFNISNAKHLLGFLGITKPS